MRQYARHLKGRVDEGKLAGSTINTYWNYIAAFLGWCVYEELLAENPARKRRAEEELPDKRPRSDRQQFWSQNDREALLAHLNKRAHAAVDKQGLDAIKELRDRALASLLAYSGVRGAEVLRDPNDQRRGGIRWRDVDLEAGTLVVLGKNQTDEEAPVPPQVRDPLERLQQALRPVSDEWPVFLTLHRPTLSRTARTALASAGFDAEEIEEAIDGYEWVELYRAYDVVPPALTTNGGRTVMRRVCEDAEISVRLAAAGWDSLYVDESFGEGLMPAVFEAYKSQFHRWAFGNVKILFSRLGEILRSKMSRRQKVDFMVSNLHWFDGLFVTAIALALLYMGLGPVIGYDAVTHHQRELLLLTLVPIALFVDSIVRLHLVLRQADDVRVWDSLLVQGMWFSIKITNVAATLKYMLGFSTPFVRTPKGLGQDLSRSGALLRSIRLTTFETVMGIVLVAVAAVNATLVRPDPEAIGTAFLAGWLTLYGLFFLSAPTYAYLSYRTLEPAEFDGIPLQDAEPEDWVEFEVAPPPETVGMESTQEPGEPS